VVTGNLILDNQYPISSSGTSLFEKTWILLLVIWLWFIYLEWKWPQMKKYHLFTSFCRFMRKLLGMSKLLQWTAIRKVRDIKITSMGSYFKSGFGPSNETKIILPTWLSPPPTHEKKLDTSDETMPWRFSEQQIPAIGVNPVDDWRQI